jgi:hypothetical protein
MSLTAGDDLSGYFLCRDGPHDGHLMTNSTITSAKW